MEQNELQNQITVEVTINAPVHKVWKVWSSAEDIMQWNAPSDTWHTSFAEIDFKTSGKFLFRMEAKDKSSGFDHGDDGRESIIKFLPDGGVTHITEIFEAEQETPLELQRNFCLGVLNNLKTYIESCF